ncbi:MAG: glycosyltransferase family 4 protein [Candidatus Omnitrophica bacterium]|nr:glycosyltransferase family 4 protein [Candidatus Omnitrophota bacterium]
MQIGIDIRSTLKKKTGIGKYTLNLINALARVDSENNYYLYSRKKFLDFKRRLPRLPGANFSHCRVLRDLDVFHTSSYDLEKPKKAKYIVTIHDVIIKAYPHGHNEQTIKEVDEKLKRVLAEADVLVADSYNTKADLVKFYQVDEKRISVIYPGVNTPNSELRTPNSDIQKYILFVGTLEPRKNVEGVIKAFDWLKKEYGIKHKLYIVGMKGWMFENIFKAYENSEFKKDIVFKGYVQDTELSDLYRNASVFVYPSFYEGFGFPIIEAFSVGTPVVTSRTSSCGEIGKDSALLVDPANYKDIGERILKIINSEDLQKELAKRGIDRAKEFSWDRTAKEFLKLITPTLSQCNR